MKTKLLILASLLNWAYFASADETTTTTKEVEIMVNDDGENVTKKIIVNGKQLTPEEIEEFEANGHMKTLHLDHDALSKSGHKVMVMKSDGTDHANMEKHIEIIKKHSGDIDNEDIQVFVTKDGDETTEKVVVNGKELSEEEIAEFKIEPGEKN